MSIRHDTPPLKNRGRNRAKRAKSFRSEDAADAWAKANNIENYKLINLHPDAKMAKIKVEFY